MKLSVVTVIIGTFAVSLMAGVVVKMQQPSPNPELEAEAEVSLRHGLVQLANPTHPESSGKPDRDLHYYLRDYDWDSTYSRSYRSSKSSSSRSSSKSSSRSSKSSSRSSKVSSYVTEDYKYLLYDDSKMFILVSLVVLSLKQKFVSFLQVLLPKDARRAGRIWWQARAPSPQRL